MVLVHSDQRQELVDGEHDDLETACRKAFDMADQAARPGWRGGSEPPLWVSVYHGKALEVSIQVAV